MGSTAGEQGIVMAVGDWENRGDSGLVDSLVAGTEAAADGDDGNTVAGGDSGDTDGSFAAGGLGIEAAFAGND